MHNCANWGSRLVPAAMRSLQVITLNGGAGRLQWNDGSGSSSQNQSCHKRKETQDAETITAVCLHSPTAYYGLCMEAVPPPYQLDVEWCGSLLSLVFSFWNCTSSAAFFTRVFFREHDLIAILFRHYYHIITLTSKSGGTICLSLPPSPQSSTRN